MKGIFTLCSLFIIASNIFGQIDTPNIRIGNQYWMLFNLNVTLFSNGDSIKQIKTNEEWEYAFKMKIPGWCYYDNDSTNYKTCGRLYNYYAINDSRRIAPKGFRIPTKNDIDALRRYLGDNDSDFLKLASKSEWIGNWGRNESGFNALPSGCRKITNFEYKSTSAFFWTSDCDNRNNCFILFLNGDFPCVAILSPYCGYSVRCLKDQSLNTK